MDFLGVGVVVCAGVAALIVIDEGLRYQGFGTGPRAVAAVTLLILAGLRAPLILPSPAAGFLVWFAASLLAVLATGAFGTRSWTLVDTAARAALLASFLDYFSSSIRGAGAPEIVALFGYVAIAGFILRESRQARLLQRPAGLVAGEILVTSGALSLIVKTGWFPGLASTLAGGALIILRVRDFLKEKEEHRILVRQTERPEKVEPEYTGPSPECPEPQLWSMYDPMTAEVEVLDLLRALVRALKPALVVETGTFTGISSLSIAGALKENGRGRLVTCEFDEAVHQRAVERFSKSPLASLIDCRRCSSLDLAVDQPIDMLFCDSSLDIREAEVRHFLPQVNPFGLILIHDAGSHFKVVREAAFRMESEGLISTVAVSTPRGLVIAQKREGRR